MNRLIGKVCIVTGGARGLGASFAKHMVEEGAKVVITDLLDKEGKETAVRLGANALFMHQDVTKEADWQRVVADTEAKFGPVSVLVNNAGTTIHGPFDTMEESAFRHVIDVNQISVFLGMKSVVSSMKRNGKGSIINISSVAGLVGFPTALPYVASKFAVRGMTKAAALELSPLNIRVNSVHPGFVRTPLTALGPESEALFTAIAKAIPVGRIAEPEELAGMVVLLASDESSYTTGGEFAVDGGLSCQ